MKVGGRPRATSVCVYLLVAIFAAAAPGAGAAGARAAGPPPARPARPAGAPGAVHLIPRGQVMARAALRYRSGRYVELVAARSVSYTAPGNQPVAITLNAVPRTVSGPLPAGAPEGTAVLRSGGAVVAQVPLVTAHAVSEATLGQRLGDYFSRPVTLALLAGLLACSLLLAILRRRATRRRQERVERRTGTEVA